jgi:hypothetical protein
VSTATTTRLAGEIQPRGKHLISDEQRIERGRRYTEAIWERVIYDLQEGYIQVSLLTRPDGTLFADGTIATVRVVDGDKIATARESNFPRISVFRVEDPGKEYGGDHPGLFEARVDTGTIPIGQTQAFAEALSVTEMLIWRLECKEIDAMLAERDQGEQ